MLLQLSIPAEADTAPDDPQALDAAHAAASQKASVWTQPVYRGETTSPAGTRLLHYTVDAQPKLDPSIVITRNIAPTLLPPRT